MRVVGIMFCLIVVAMCGCGGDPGPQAVVEEVVPASGTLTYRGQPLPYFRVTFTPSDGKRVATGLTDESGKFTLGTNAEGDGAPPGTHKVSVVWAGPPAAEGSAGNEQIIDDPAQMPKPAVQIPPKYASEETSGLTQTVPDSGSTELKVDLQ